MRLGKIVDIDMSALTLSYSLKKDYEEEFLTLLRDMIKQITNTYMIPKNR